jgi:hypothetical protein
VLVGGAAPPGGIVAVDVVVLEALDEAPVVVELVVVEPVVVELVVVELADAEVGVVTAVLFDEDDAGGPEPPPHPASSAEMPAAAIDATMLARVIRSLGL